MLLKKHLKMTAFYVALIFIPQHLFAQLQENRALQESYGRLELVENLEMRTARFGFGFVHHGNQIFISNGSGIENSHKRDLEIYDIETDTWHAPDLFLHPKRYSSLEIVDNKLYVFNGSFGYSMNDDLEIVDIESNTISVEKGRPSAASQAGSATLSGKIYSFGGSYDKNHFSDHFYKYNPKSKKWIELASMPEQKETRGVFIDGILYTVGGFNGEMSNKIHTYDPGTNEWKLFANLPYGLSANNLAKNENIIWIVGDYVNLSFIASLNVVTKKFTVYESESFIGRRHAGVVCHNNRLIVFGGNTNSKTLSSLRSMQIFEIP